jgi:hypothetical protein
MSSLRNQPAVLIVVPLEEPVHVDVVGVQNEEDCRRLGAWLESDDGRALLVRLATEIAGIDAAASESEEVDER